MRTDIFEAGKFAVLLRRNEFNVVEMIEQGKFTVERKVCINNGVN